MIGTAGLVEYYLPRRTRTAVGFTYDGYTDVPYSAWNPYAGLCVRRDRSREAGDVGHRRQRRLDLEHVGSRTRTATARVGTSRWSTRPAPPNAGAPVTGAYQFLSNQHRDVEHLQGFNASVPHDSPDVAVDRRVYVALRQRVRLRPPSALGRRRLELEEDNGYGFFELAFAGKGNFDGGPLIPSPGIQRLQPRRRSVLRPGPQRRGRRRRRQRNPVRSGHHVLHQL